jgi:hypothetical protein
MTIQTPRLSDEHIAVMAGMAALFVFVFAYIALCFVVLHRPEWLAGRSIFYASLVGPPRWLAWGPASLPMFWGSTFSIALVATVGAIFRPLVLVSAGLCFLIWLGAGFLSVAMSV